MAAIHSVIHTNRHSIDRVLGAGVPVTLVFARGDRPLDAELGAALDRAASNYSGKLLVARIDAGEEPDLVRRYSVGLTPALVAVKSGEHLETVNSANAQDVEAWANYLAGKGARPPSRREATPGGASEQAGGVVKDLTDATFAAATSGPLPVLVDFWAPWCAPCRTVAPSVERLGREFASRAQVAKLNVDENPVTAQRYGVRSIPTLLILRNGTEVDRVVGAQPYEVLKQRLARLVA